MKMIMGGERHPPIVGRRQAQEIAKLALGGDDVGSPRDPVEAELLEPLGGFGYVGKRASADGQLSLETYPMFEEIARREGFWTDELANSVREHGTVRGLEGVPEKWQRIAKVACQSPWQPWQPCPG